MDRQQRLKIAFVSQPWNHLGPPPNAGSIAILTYEVARRLVDSCDITIYGRRAEHEDSESWHEGICYRRMPVELERKVARYLKRFYPSSSARRPYFASRLYYLAYATQIARDLKKRSIDLVQLFNFSQFANVIRSYNPTSKIVLRMSCDWLTQLDPTVTKPALRKIDAIVGCSSFITNRIISAHPEVAGRCRTILNGRDVNYSKRIYRSQTRTDKDRKRILFVGRVSPEKGLHVLIEAFVKVLEHCPDIHLDIVGPLSMTPEEFSVSLSDDQKVRDLAVFYDRSTDYYDSLRAMIPGPISDSVSFIGPVEHSKLVDWYQCADVFVFPSIWDEPSGNPPIEAMILGIPVVSTRTGGTPEYVDDGVTGILVGRDDSTELAKAIVELLEHDNLRSQMGDAARERATRLFSYEKMARELLNLYEQLCAR